MAAPPDFDRAALGRLAELLMSAGRGWVLTGAGMSTESGLPDYRGPSGMWRNRRFEELASLGALQDEPAEFWDFYRMRLDHLAQARPNAAHHALARLEAAGAIERVVTQNVDGLHQAAGSRRVLELHGSLRRARCRMCGTHVDMEETRARWVADRDGIPWCDCGSPLGPGVVLFGEALPPEIDEAFELAETSDLVFALGTSLAVFPAAHLPLVTVERGGHLGIVTHGSTEFDELATVRIDAPLGSVLPALADLVLDAR